MRLLGTTAMASAIVLTWAGCSGGGTQTTPPACDTPYTPVVQQLYPIPGTTGVPPTGEMVLASSGAATEIDLNAVHSDVTTPTHPHSVPNPLPSPAATPNPDETTIFAVSFRQLKAHTRYGVTAVVTENPNCFADVHPADVNVGSFTTR